MVFLNHCSIWFQHPSKSFKQLNQQKFSVLHLSFPFFCTQKANLLQKYLSTKLYVLPSHPSPVLHPINNQFKIVFIIEIQLLLALFYTIGFIVYNVVLVVVVVSFFVCFSLFFDLLFSKERKMH